MRLPRYLFLFILIAACVYGCAGQGHSTTATTAAFSVSAVFAFLFAAMGFPTAMVLALVGGFGTLAIAPKYPIYPPTDPKGEQHETPPKPIQNRSLYEIIFQ